MAGKVSIIGVPMDLGASRRGVDMGPSAMRVTRLVERIRELGREAEDTGDVVVPIPESCGIGDERMKFAGEIAQVCEDLHDRAMDVLARGSLPVVLGGDHSLAMGSIAATAHFHRMRGESIGVIWLDAHGDMNTPESTGTGNVHGMPLAHVLGMGDPRLASIGGFRGKVDPARCALIGVRDLDEREKSLIQASGARVFTMMDIDRRGAAAVMEEALAATGAGTAGVHVSFDIDACDPEVAPGVGTPKRGGLSYREAHLSLELLADSDRILAMDMVEINPVFDVRNRTAELGAELILSALGKRIF